MTVHFIGAGPGAPDLITIRGRDLIRRCPVCLYAGTLVPREVVAFAPEGALVVDTGPLDLDRIIALMREAEERGQDVARVHSGDPSIYGAIAEQIERLKALGISYTITPGVPAFAASAAALGVELTVPGVAQSIVLTRTSRRSSAMPPGETLAAFGATGATLAIHLSAGAIDSVVEALMPHYGPDCPAAVVVRASWPDEQVIRGTLADIAGRTREAGVERTATILVGRVLAGEGGADSALYQPGRARHGRPEG